MHPLGVIIGHFEPLHLGHMRTILYASGQVSELHLIITTHPNPNSKYNITLQDKARWLQMACQNLPFIHIHTTDEINLPAHDDFSTVDTHSINIPLTNAKLQLVLERLDITTSIISDKSSSNVTIQTDSNFKSTAPWLFFANNHPLGRSHVSDQLILKIVTTPEQTEFQSAHIMANPVKYWQAIHPEARSSYTKTVALVGGESSGKTTLVHKLANYYGASFALEMGRLYVGTNLGGAEVGLQYSDYAPIALDHAEAIRVAKYRAPAPITLVDTDFVTTQAFCEEYERRTHPFVTACIDEFRLNHTIFLTNNTPWVDDGMRTLGSESARERFERRLNNIFARHRITPYRISSPDYFERYRQAIIYIDEYIYSETNSI